jgi:hypothetical protein
MSAEWVDPEFEGPSPAPRRKSGHLKVLTAASSNIQLDNKEEAQIQRQLRQNWQLQAWTYRDSIPELRYALNFLANCASRMRVFVACYPLSGETSAPIDIHDPAAGGFDLETGDPIPAPDDILNACENALRDLGNGKLAIDGVMHSLSTNLSVTGEAFMLALLDPITLKTTYSIRSISEVVVYNGKVMLREGPMTNNGMLGLTPLPPGSIVQRMWKPHPQFRVLADCAMRALVNTCEDIQILRRTIRATGRSRIAGRGVLFVPTEIDVPSLNDDDESADADDFTAKLTNAMIVPIRNEGDSSGVVPLVVSADAESIDHIKHITFESTFDAASIAVRAELIGNLATGLDLPAEIIKGMMDANHWTAYQVSADTVRQHVEPHVIDELECLTGAFLRPYLSTCGLDAGLLDQWLERIIFWYDPTDLVTPPDLSGSAQIAYNMEIISAKSTRKYMGFTDDDAPSAEETELRLVSKTRNWPPNALIALLHDLDPELAFPPITQAGMFPGLKAETDSDPGGVDIGVPTAPGTTVPTAPVNNVSPPATPSAPPLGGPPGPPQPVVGSGRFADLSMTERAATIQWARQELIRQIGYDPYAQAVQPVESLDVINQVKAMFEVLRDEIKLSMRPITAAAPPKPLPSAKTRRLNQKLLQIDTDLRRRIQVEANAEVRAQMVRAGSRVKSSVSKDPTLRKRIAATRTEFVAMKLGQAVVESKGFTAADLMNSNWDSFEERFKSWVTTAQQQAVKTAAELAGIDAGVALAQYQAALNAGVDAGWRVLKDAMDAIAVHALYNPDPSIDEEAAIAALNPDTIVPVGVIRAALGVAGGSPLSDWKSMVLNTGADVPALSGQFPSGGVATGATISDLLSSSGATTTDYEWVHGPSEKVFEPHELLDGVTFSSFTDSALQNTGDWPDNAYFLPGDHPGCLCDAMPMWVSAADVQAARDAAGGE